MGEITDRPAGRRNPQAGGRAVVVTNDVASQPQAVNQGSGCTLDDPSEQGLPLLEADQDCQPTKGRDKVHGRSVDYREQGTNRGFLKRSRPNYPMASSPAKIWTLYLEAPFGLDNLLE